MTCSKCKTAEAVPYHRWCSECRAEYARGYRRIAGERQRVRIEKDFRERAIDMFENLGDRGLNGYTAAELVRRLE